MTTFELHSGLWINHLLRLEKKNTLTFNHILFPWIQNPKMTAKEKDISTILL